MAFTFMEEKSTEEKVIVMDKTISRFSGKDNHKIVTDNLNPEVGAKEMQKELDKDKDKKVIPLFRFRSKYYDLLLTYMNEIVNEVRNVRNEDGGKKYENILNYLKVTSFDDNKHLLDLAIMRNRNALASEKKLLRFELVTCLYEKKLRVKYSIPEEETITIERYPEFHKERKDIEESFRQLCGFIIKYHGTVGMKEVMFYNNLTLTVERSAGSEDYGYGFSLVLDYHQQIDWTNDSRSQEGWELFPEEFKKEQINVESRGIEADDDFGGDDEDDGGGDDSGDDEGGGDDFGGDDEDGDDDFGGGDDDFGGDGDEGGDDDGGFGGGDDDSGDDSYGDSKPKAEKGEHLFADINGKSKISGEFQELINQIDRVLGAFEKIGLKNVVVNKLVELKELVKDSLRIALVTDIEESLFRYSLYVKQFDILVSSIKEDVMKSNIKK